MYERPPRDWIVSREVLWKSLKLPYSSSDNGKQWQKTTENWMLAKRGLERAQIISHLLVVNSK